MLGNISATVWGLEGVLLLNPRAEFCAFAAARDCGATLLLTPVWGLDKLLCPEANG